MKASSLLVILFASNIALAASPQAAKLTIGTKGNELAFDKSELRVKPGQSVKLTFTNRADKASALQHNWVLTKSGADQEVASAAIVAGSAKQYIPDSPAILAHTKLLNPGESETVTFKAPAEAGEYPYICTFPGHAQLLKGKLIVGK